MNSRRARAGLLETRKEAGIRASGLTSDDGQRLFDSHDLLAVGGCQFAERKSGIGPRHILQLQIRIEGPPTSAWATLSVLLVRAVEGQRRSGAYTMSAEEGWDKLRHRAHQPITEVHGRQTGLTPIWPFET